MSGTHVDRIVNVRTVCQNHGKTGMPVGIDGKFVSIGESGEIFTMAGLSVSSDASNAARNT